MALERGVFITIEKTIFTGFQSVSRTDRAKTGKPMTELLTVHNQDLNC